MNKLEAEKLIREQTEKIQLYDLMSDSYTLVSTSTLQNIFPPNEAMFGTCKVQVIQEIIEDMGQSWFWAKEWQELEKEADKDIEKGNYKIAINWEQAKSHLDSLKRKL